MAGWAGSFGCGESGVISSVRHTRSGIEASTSSSLAVIVGGEQPDAAPFARLQRRAPQPQQVALRRQLPRVGSLAVPNVVDGLSSGVPSGT